MQSEACFEAMQIDWPIIRQQAMRRGVIMTRVAVRDFDHDDQVCIVKTCPQAHFTYTCFLARAAQSNFQFTGHDLLCMCIGAERTPFTDTCVAILECWLG